MPYTHTTQSHVVLRPGLTGILAFPQSVGALWQYDEIDCKVSYLTASLDARIHLVIYILANAYSGRFGSDESVLQQLAGSRKFIDTN